MLVLDTSLQFNSEMASCLNATAAEKVPANRMWIDFLLEKATSTHLKTIFYTATSGEHIVVNDNITSMPPSSLPGKLLAFLFQRFKHFNGAPDKGVVIVTYASACKAASLEAMILELAHLNNLKPEFLDWIENSNSFIEPSL